MNITKRDFVKTLLRNPFSAPLNIIAKGERPAVDKPAEWACYTVNAAGTGLARLAVPFNTAHFAAKDASRRGKNPLICARAATVGLLAGTAVSTVGIVVNVGQTLVSVCMLGVSSGIAAFEHGVESIDAAGLEPTAGARLRAGSTGDHQ
jgi:hypothetical protein